MYCQQHGSKCIVSVKQQPTLNPNKTADTKHCHQTGYAAGKSTSFQLPPEAIRRSGKGKGSVQTMGLRTFYVKGPNRFCGLLRRPYMDNKWYTEVPKLLCALYSTHTIIPLIRINWDGEPSGCVENPDNWIFL